jgi:two-component system, NtrC family, C4-dicarboxylate transport sensor histidine kinase DctB
MIDKLNTQKEVLFLTLLSIASWFILSSLDAFEFIITYLEQHEDYELDELLLLIIIIGLFSIIFAIRRVKEANKINMQLENINKELEDEVNFQIDQRYKKEQLLIQQSKLASLGEMIGNIAHQWRQPLNTLGLVVQNIHFTYKEDGLNDEFMDKSLNKVNLLTQNMSKTIDDFRNFFKPDKERENFNLNDLTKDTLALVEASFEHSGIKINTLDNSEVFIYGFRNEFSQTLINILNNAKDAIIDKNIEKPEVNIEIGLDNNYSFIKIKDNAGGIPSNIFDKIFDPYFTTKEEGKGTGIGLYMAKIIIEQNMKGKLEVKNINNGVEFTIKIPVYKNNRD